MFKGNKIFIVDKNGNKRRVFFVPGVNVKFKGKNSTVTFHEPLGKFSGCKISCGDNAKISIGSSRYSVRKFLLLANGDNTVVEIGKDFSVTSKCEVVMRPEPNLSLKIGNDCMFATNILLRPTDGHMIVDKETGDILNYGKDIEIGNHVWVAKDVTILKGAKIADNCVIGLGSVVTKPCLEPYSIYAGSPAKFIKTGIDWDRESPMTASVFGGGNHINAIK